MRTLIFVLLLQAAAGGGAPASAQAPASAAHSTAASPDTTGRAARAAARRAALRAAREVPLTPALLASAYDNPVTRALVSAARTARGTDDSAVLRYDDLSVERLSVWLRLGSIARERLLFRRDRAEHVRWERGLGAIVDVTGSRQAIPMVPSDEGDVEDMNEAIALPYVPGRRTLALGGQRNADTTDYSALDDIVDPLASGAEAYYRYTLGDSETIKLPTRTGGQQVIRLREIQLHPRQPIWNLGAGSLWFDVESGHLVRSVYRFAAPMDIVAVANDADPSSFKDVPFWIKPLITPMVASLDAVTIEYGLLSGRYWMPLIRFADGTGQVGMMRARVRWEMAYRYNSVNGPDTLPRLDEFTKPIDYADRDTMAIVARSSNESGASTSASAGSGMSSGHPTDTARQGDRGRQEKGGMHMDMRSGAGREDQSDSVQHARRAAQCARQSTWDHVEVHDGSVRVFVRTPCDSVALAKSADLPPSLYGSDDLFSTEDAKALAARLAASPLPDWSPRPIGLRWGLQDGLVRYNRVEGLSVGAALVDELGLGFSTRVEARLGVADLQPNTELQLTRTSPLGTVTFDAYRRLTSANDWGDPFTVGSSIWNALFGDDEGFYYRAWGGELRGTTTNGALPFSWRVFLERQWGARVGTRFSLSDALDGDGMSPHNLTADAGTLAGVAFRLRPVWGQDPDGLQAIGDFRGEGAGGTFAYARTAADLTLTHPMTRYTDLALTAGAGTSAGDVPAQRFWYLGGLKTVRGIAPGQEVGDAYWMGHFELAGRTPIAKPVVFYDLGWAGDRTNWAHQGHPISGAGIGASFLDGLIRFDVAHGIWPTHGVRVNAYWQGVF